jgi:hypothetical protein
MTDRGYVTANAEAAAELRTLAGSLDDGDLAADLGDGWTASMALAHIAFWDGWHLARWRQAIATGAVAPPLVADEVSDPANEALEATWRALAPDRAVALALATAAEVDALVAGLPDASVDAARAAGEADCVERWPHRRDHVAQIRRALGRD